MKATALDICRDDRERRGALRESDLNGLDCLEVDERDRHRLTIYFIGKLRGLGARLTREHFAITGGRRVRDIRVTSVTVCEQRDLELDDCLTLTVDHIGDFSTYTLCLVDVVDGRSTGRPHPAIDPVYACLEFSFQAGCPSTADCVTRPVCPETPASQPPIDYLAKDYASFKRLLFDRLSFLMPGWTERHEPDLLVALVELLAYEGDRLSYLQDAVATEAYLQTARQRISVRRHARLVDYHLHEGCNARAWVLVETSQDTPALSLDDFFFVTRYHGAPENGAPLSMKELESISERYEVFEPMVQPEPGPLRYGRVAGRASLCRRLLHGSDAVDKSLREKLRPAVLKMLREWDEKGEPSRELVQAVLDELERIAHDQTLIYERAFTASSTGQRLAARTSARRGRDLVRANRTLIEAAFEQQLVPPGKVQFRVAHNRIVIHTWGERGCCLPAGTTTVSLVDRDRGLRLEPGDFLLFEEVRSPTTGLDADADPSHRHVVRVTHVEPIEDPVLRVPLVDVRWAPQDALPFPLCLSSRGPAPECEWLEEISVARGNVLLVDHGCRESDELDAVEVASINQPCDGCRPETELVPRPYRPVLEDVDLTFAQPIAGGVPAHALLTQDPREALPALRLEQLPVVPPRLDWLDPLDAFRNPVPLTMFEPPELVSPVPLIVRLRNAASTVKPPSKDLVASYLRDMLDTATQTAVDAFDESTAPSQALIDGILRLLNAALDDTGLYDEARFPDAHLDEATLALRGGRPLPIDLERLFNRWLLEQACGDALSPSRHFVRRWSARFDLLASAPDDLHFVVEMSDDRRAFLRFGDDTMGEQPEAASRFRAFYRVGNGVDGNVGAETIALFVSRTGRIDGITLRPRNPMAAVGGVEPESVDAARRRAPHAIRRDMVRAVTARDYGALAARDFVTDLQGAAAELVWTGSWYEAQVTVDPFGREDAPPTLLRTVRDNLERYRRLGHELRLAATRYVPLSIVLRVCVRPDVQQAHVRSALMDLCGAHRLPDGTLGFFHPDNLRFARSVDASQIVALAQRVPGVVWSRVTKLERLGEGAAGEVDEGTLRLGPSEIARVGSAGGAGARPGFPELGSITFEMEGGR